MIPAAGPAALPEGRSGHPAGCPGRMAGHSGRPVASIRPPGPSGALPWTSLPLAWADPAGPSGGIYPAGLAHAGGRMLSLEIDVSQVYVFLGVGACPPGPWQRARRPFGWAVSILLHQLPLGASALDL